MSGIPENPMVDIKSRICNYSIGDYINLLFDLAQMTAILDFALIFKVWNIQHIFLLTHYLKNIWAKFHLCMSI